MLQIGINGLYIKWGVNAGTETYFTNIVKPWYESEKRGLCFTLYCNQLPPWWDGEKKYFKVKVFPSAIRLSIRLFLEQLILPFTYFRKLDVLFSPGYVGSIMSRKLQIITIHDAFAWKFPSKIGWMRGLYWRVAIPLTAKRAARVIAVSKSTATDVANFCNVPLSKIAVVPEAGGHLKGIVPNNEVIKKLGLQPKSYFHCVGFFKEIKNPWRILEAYKKYTETCNHDKCKRLVLVGSADGEGGKEILAAARTIPNVVFAGRIDDHQLAAIYEGSAGLIFPSLYEGFGIPILEAQSFGCPVVTSDNSSMPEVAGEGAIFVDPYSVDAICNALYIISSTAQEIIEKGKMNLMHFSWDTASKETLKLIRELDSEDRSK